jgi:hypothetical protein
MDQPEQGLLFDGLLVGGPVALIAGAFALFKTKKKASDRTQSQQSGSNSTNLQAGRDINLGEQSRGGDEDEGSAPG